MKDQYSIEIIYDNGEREFIISFNDLEKAKKHACEASLKDINKNYGIFDHMGITENGDLITICKHGQCGITSE